MPIDIDSEFVRLPTHAQRGIERGVPVTNGKPKWFYLRVTCIAMVLPLEDTRPEITGSIIVTESGDKHPTHLNPDEVMAQLADATAYGLEPEHKHDEEGVPA